MKKRLRIFGSCVMGAGIVALPLVGFGPISGTFLLLGGILMLAGNLLHA